MNNRFTLVKTTSLLLMSVLCACVVSHMKVQDATVPPVVNEAGSDSALILDSGVSDSDVVDASVADATVSSDTDASVDAGTVVDNTAFINYIWTAMKVWVPLANQCLWDPNKDKYQKCLDDADKHYQEIATTIVEVISEPGIRLPITNVNNLVKSALLMTSIASTESRYEKKVDTCEKSGDRGLAFGLWQTQIPYCPKSVTCSNRAAALRCAIKLVNQSFDACKNYPLADRLSVYAAGTCNHTRGVWHSRRKVNRAIDYLKAHPYESNVP